MFCSGNIMLTYIDELIKENKNQSKINLLRILIGCLIKVKEKLKR